MRAAVLDSRCQCAVASRRAARTSPRRLSQSALSAALVLLLAPAEAPAEQPSAVSASRTGTTARAPRAASSAPVVGWSLMLACLAAGAATTVYGLSVACTDDDASCRRRSSLAIWGGVGIASLGSAIGLGVARGEHTGQRRPTQLGSTLVTLTGAF